MEIASAIGVSEATIKRELANNAALRLFIQPQQEYRLSGGKGGVRRDANSYRIAMDDIVHEEDSPRVEEYILEAEAQRQSAERRGTRDEVAEAKLRAKLQSDEPECWKGTASGQFDPAQLERDDVRVKLTRQPCNLTRRPGQIDPTVLEDTLDIPSGQTLNVGEPSYIKNSYPQIKEARVQEVVHLTGDQGSHRRFRQLLDIAWINGCGNQWEEAVQATRSRMSNQQDPVARPGAYFCSVLVTLLRERGVAVPVGDREERASIGRQIQESLAMGPPAAAATSPKNAREPGPCNAVEEGPGAPADYPPGDERSAKAATPEADTGKCRAEQQAGQKQGVEAAKTERMQDAALWASIEAEARTRLPVPLRDKPSHVAYEPALKAKITEVVAERAAQRGRQE